jgi:lipid-binding SYLF domain-containing protein
LQTTDRLCTFIFLSVYLGHEWLKAAEETMLSRRRGLCEKRLVLLTIATLCLVIPRFAIAEDNEHEQERVKESGNVIKELLDSPSGIPISVLNKAECVIVLPSVKKAGFIVAGQYGRGVMTCRGGENLDGPWSPPTMMQSSGGSFGLQAGGQATDFVVLVMNDKGARALMKGKAKLGADASVAAGPVGRDAEASTNGAMSAECSLIPERRVCLPASLCRGPRSDLMGAPMKNFMARR